MAAPPVPPPPLDSALVRGDGKASPTWAKWLELLWNKARVSSAGGGSGDLSDTNPQPIGTAAPGVATEASRADHVHAHGNLAGGALHAVAIASGAAGFLSGADKAKLDGLSAGVALTSSSPANVGTTAVGVATDAARADHVHGHGNLAGGSLHAVAVAGVSAGFISADGQTKLDVLITPGQIVALIRFWALP